MMTGRDFSLSSDVRDIFFYFIITQIMDSFSFSSLNISLKYILSIYIHWKKKTRKRLPENAEYAEMRHTFYRVTSF